MTVSAPGRVHVSSYLALLGYIAVAYWVTGRLALWLAIPPGYAAAVWPPAGIALAATLRYGSRVWPGILTGSFLVNIATAFNSTNVATILTSLVLPLSIGVGAVLQARFGAWLVRRYIGFPTTLRRQHDVAACLLLGGPIGCLVNATWGVSSLLLSGAVAWEQSLFHWWTWWVGDSIGALVVIPLLLVWTAEPRQAWRRYRLSMALPIGLAFVMVVAFFVYARASEQARIKLAFEQRAYTLAHTLRSSFDGYLDALHSIKSLYRSIPQVGRHDFHTFVQYVLARYPGIQALSWDRRVSDVERVAYEKAIRQEGHRAFQITEQNPWGQLVPASQRPEYVTVTYIEPHAGNENALGYDVASGTNRFEALQQARDTGEARSTGRIMLVQEVAQQFGLLIFLPLYRHELRYDTIEERRQNLQGYATGVFRLGDMIEAALDGLGVDGMVLQLHDETAPVNERLLYRRQWPLPADSWQAVNAAPGAETTGLHWHTLFDIAGRRWLVQFSTTPTYLAAQRIWNVWAMLACGLLFVGLLGAFLLVLIGRTVSTENLVAERTAANVLLEGEIAERQRIENTLRQSEERFARVFQASPIGISISRLADGHFIDVNPTFLEMFGYPRAAVLGQTAATLQLWGQPETQADLEAQLSAHRPIRDVDIAFRRHSGDVGEALCSAERIELAGETCLLILLRDMTARRQAEAALRESEVRYRELFENANDLLYTHDLAGNFTALNRLGEQLTGYNRQSVLTMNISQLIVPEHLQRVRQMLARALAGSPTTSYEVDMLTSQGQRRTLEVSTQLISQAGTPIGVQGIGRDITERKRLEAQLRQAQKMEAVGTLAGGIAHDFNNILMAIMGYSELTLQAVPAASTAWNNLQAVLSAGKRATALVQQILTFCHHTEQERQPMQLHPLIQETLTLLRATLPTTIELRQALDEDLGTILAEPSQLHQVLINLCTNAAQAMRASAGVLEVRLEAAHLPTPGVTPYPDLAPGSYLCLSVRDTGHGMQPETIERIFEPFFTTKGPRGGTGLGLAVVHGIIVSHGGAMAVESAPEQGTTVRVYLPRSAQLPAPVAQHEEPVPPGYECILFVDDEEALTRLAQAYLTQLGYAVVACTSSTEALAMFQTDPALFSLVITDQTMPQMTGESLTRALRRLRPDLPIILCTGFSDTMSAERAQSLNLDAFCMKPLTLHDLGLTVHQVLERRRAAQPIVNAAATPLQAPSNAESRMTAADPPLSSL